MNPDPGGSSSRRRRGRGRNYNGRVSRGKPSRQNRGGTTRGRGSSGRGVNRDSRQWKGRKRLSPEEQQIRNITQRMNTFANKGNISATEELFGQILQQCLNPSVITMNVLLKAYIRGKQLHKALKLLENMESGAPEACGVEVDEGSYNVVINALADTGRVDAAWAYIDRQFHRGFRTTKSTSSLIRKLTPDEVEDLISTTESLNRIQLNVNILSTLVRVLCLASPPRTEKAIALICKAESLGIKPDCRTYSILIQRFSSDHNIELAKKYFRRALFEHEVQPDLIMLTAILNALVEAQPPEMKEAHAMVDSMYELYGIHPDIMVYNLLIKGYTRMQPANYLEAHQVLNTCVEKGLTPSVVTFASVANAYCSLGLPAEAEALTRTAMANNQLKPNATIFNTLIKGYARCRCSLRAGSCSCIICSCSDPERAMHLLDEMERNGLPPDEITLNTIVVAFCSSKQIDRAKAVIDEVMRSKIKNGTNISPSANTYRVLLQGILRFSSKFRDEEESLKYERLCLDIEEDMLEERIEIDPSINLVFCKIYLNLQCSREFAKCVIRSFQSGKSNHINECLLLFLLYEEREGLEIVLENTTANEILETGLLHMERLGAKPSKQLLYEIVQFYVDMRKTDDAFQFILRFYPPDSGSLQFTADSLLSSHHTSMPTKKQCDHGCCSGFSNTSANISLCPKKNQASVPTVDELDLIVRGYIRQEQPDQADLVCEEFEKRYRVIPKNETKKKLAIALNVAGLQDLSTKYIVST